MRAAVARLRERTAGLRSADDGISVTEVLMAMTVFVVVSAALLSALTVGFGMSRSNRARVVAINLAASDLDRVRSIDYAGIVSSTYASTVGKDSFTVTRTVRPQLAGPGSEPCVGGTGIREFYKKVTVKVDWANRTFAQPVRADTLVRSTALTAPTGAGAAGVVVTDRAGKPLQGITVGVNSTTVPTDEDGCAYFSPLPAKTYPVTITATGYVDSNEQGLGGLETTVVENQIARLPLTIDKAATLTLVPTVVGPGGAALAGFGTPATTGLRLENPTNTTAQRALTSTGGPVVASGVYPENHVAFGGSCLDGENYGAGALASFTPAPGQSATVAVPFAGVTITASGSTFPGGTLTAVREADATCAAGETVTLGTLPAGASASLNGGLPYGAWKIRFTPSSGTASTTAASYTLAPNQPPTAVTVVSP
ncbi:MAG TPA: carboxypeptidase regulatory-like domain-containing protein [Mycobacteriales bacterium]|jgi:hypothetical protein|nr:carboxypeptidase regulatory-like domain-containing protein [Mycobacteriales bacterium]